MHTSVQLASGMHVVNIGLDEVLDLCLSTNQSSYWSTFTSTVRGISYGQNNRRKIDLICLGFSKSAPNTHPIYHILLIHICFSAYHSVLYINSLYQYIKFGCWQWDYGPMHRSRNKLIMNKSSSYPSPLENVPASLVYVGHDVKKCGLIKKKSGGKMKSMLTSGCKNY